MRYLTVREVLDLHERLLRASGGASGLRDFGSLVSALIQLQMKFEGRDLYPSLAEKAAALAYSIIMNHPFLDGNKRTGHAAMEVFLMLNGYELRASVDEAEQIILSVAAGQLERARLADWVRKHLAPT
jgi:death-on-curing protein